MLSQVDLWAERASMVLDVILMVRIVTLKLSRTYVFISLFALLSLLYDGVALRLGLESVALARVMIFSKFVYAIVYPLVTWDLFEEAKPLVEKIRRLAMSRMVSSLLFILLWGLLIAAFTGGDEGGESQYLLQLAIVVWTGSVAATLAFLWVMRRGVKIGKFELPHNTSIWFRYFQLSLVVEAVACVLFLLQTQGFNTKVIQPVAQIGYPALTIFGIFLTGWCAFKLRAVPTDGSDVPARVTP